MCSRVQHMYVKTRFVKRKNKYIDDEKINHELTPIIAIHKKLVFFP